MRSVLAYTAERPGSENEARFIGRRELEPFRSNSKAKKAQKKEEHSKPEGSNPGGDNPKEKERKLLAAYQRGDKESGKKVLNEIIGNILEESLQNLEVIRFRALELIILLSRAAFIPEASDSHALLETNSKNLKRIQESKSIEELVKNLHLAVERMAGKIFLFQGKRHASALRRAQRFIWENYARKISLKEISDAAGLSAPYFSTVFKEEMGENLSNYLNRLRVEKAAVLLTDTSFSLSKIACSCGFEDQSWFSKIFKHYAGTSPGKYRSQGGKLLNANHE
jgi:YesN/AraC family two-component response regulator